MKIILIPGLWLTADSWAEVASRLSAAGHTVQPLTLPGVGAEASAAADIGMADWVAAVVAKIDETSEPVVLVGHSGGGNVAWGAADARPEQVARVIFVDTVPPPPGSGISEFPITAGVIEFPGWDFFPSEDTFDLDEATREVTSAQTQSVPPQLPTDPIELSDQRRFEVPVTLLMGSLDAAEVRAQISEWGAYGEEFASLKDVQVERIGSAHWPQFSQPARLADLIIAAID